MHTLSKTQINVWLASLVLAPLLLTAAHLFGNTYALNETSGWLGVLAFTVWILAFQGLFRLVQDRMPVYAVVGFVLAVYGCVAGTNFMVDGIYLEALGIDTVTGKNDLHARFGIGGLLAFYLPGLLFPLSFVALGISYLRTKILPPWLAVFLIVAGICFPLGRIPRIAALIHLDNVLMLVSHILIALEARKQWMADEPSQHELSTKTNEQRLDAAIEKLRQGETMRKNLIEE